MSRILALNDDISGKSKTGDILAKGESRTGRSSHTNERQPNVPANEVGVTNTDTGVTHWQSFYTWLVSQGKSKRTIKHYVSYAQRFGSVLDTGDANAIIIPLKPASHHHALSALANLAKYTGRYDRFNQIRRNYNLRWTKTDSIKHFERFFSQELSFDVMMQRIRLMMEKLPMPMQQIIRFACLVGLRCSEVIESVRLLGCSGPERTTKQQYYNPDRQALEHFRFPEIFLRQTKKAYISFVTKEQLSGIAQMGSPTPSLNAITHACHRRGIKMEMKLCRKIHASWLRKEGIQPEIIDMLQGRVSQSILTRHYLVPQPSLRDDVLQALEKLQQQL